MRADRRRALGFVISEPETTFHRGLRETEAAIGLERYGPRVQMTAEIVTASGPAATNLGQMAEG